MSRNNRLISASRMFRHIITCLAFTMPLLIAPVAVSAQGSPVPTSIAITPGPTLTLTSLGTQSFTAIVDDQFGNPMSPQPAVTWSVVPGGVGSISDTGGFFHTGPVPGSATIKARSGSLSATVAVTVDPSPVTVDTPASATPNPAAGSSTWLSASGAYGGLGGSASLTYSWVVTSGPASVTFSNNDSLAARTTEATFTQAGTYDFTVTIASPFGTSTTSSVSVTVEQTATSIVVTPGPTLDLSAPAAQQFTATVDDQFGAVMSPQPSITWTLESGGVGSISSGGLYHTGTVAGSATVQARSGLAQGACSVQISAGFAILHSFGDGSVANDGLIPYAGGVIQGADGNFYGTTQNGGSASNGTVFEITPAGVVTIMHSFGDGSVANDGQQPDAGLVEVDGNFYGTTTAGGSANDGTVFKITRSGVVTILHSFHDGSVANDGEDPGAALIHATDGNFYGTTNYGGSVSRGTVFKMTPSGTVTILHSFRDGSVANDGFGLDSPLTEGVDGNFYGTTAFGGSTNGTGFNDFGDGTAFEITLSGHETVLHSFADGSVVNDGNEPFGALVQVDGNFYGTTTDGGSTSGAGPYNNGSGTMFMMTPSGVETILHSFADGSVVNEGSTPTGLIMGSDGNFYGTTYYGGASGDDYGDGTLFQITPLGVATVLHSFGDGTVLNDGMNPRATPIQASDGSFYGTTAYGGSASNGTVYHYN